MATLTDYKGLEVVDPDPTGAGGLAVQNDFKKLVDWQAAVLDRGVDTPPGSPMTGDRYIVGTSPTGDWDRTPSIANDLVEWDGSAWLALEPQVGFPVYVTDEQLLYYWDGTDWLPVASGTGALAQTFDVYDAAGGQTFTTGTITLNLDTVRKNSDGNIFSLANDELTISDTAVFVFVFRVSTDVNTGTARSTSKCWLETDTGGGFAEVTGSRGYMYNRLAGPGENTATVQVVLDVASGDKFRVQVNREAGSDTIQTIANASGLTVFKFGTPGLVGTAGDPAGSDTQVQFNNAGVFGADASFTYDNAATALSVDNLRLDGNTLSSTDTNGPIIILPNGTGALQRDAGGNARGLNAVDLQGVRSAATQVASGARSVIGGGQNNTADTYYSTVSGGSGNTASSGFATVAGGFYNTASGLYSFAVGERATASLRGQAALAAGRFSADGDAQTSVLTARNTTTNATQTELFLDGSSARITIPTDTTWTFWLLLTARRADADNESAGWRIEGVIDNNAGTTALVGSVSTNTLGDDSGGTWQVVADANDTNDALRLRVTGEASKTIRWLAAVQLAQITG